MKSSFILSRIALVLAVAVLCLLVFSGNPLELRAQSAGAYASADAKAKDVGLPLYPGSKPHTDSDDSNSSAQLGLWFGNTGFQLVVLKMESADTPDKIANYYRKALGKYGTVLDCTNAAARSDKDSSNKLTCGDDKPDAGGMLFKAGTKERQHIVDVQPNGNGTVYKLVYLVAKDKGHDAEL